MVDDDAAPTFVRELSPAGDRLGTGDGDRVVLLCDIGALDDIRHHAVQRACTLTGGGLDPGEWARFVPDLPYRESCPA